MFNQVGIGFRQDVKRENAHSYDGTFVGYNYESWVMGLRPDKSMGTRRVMDIDGPNGSAQIYAHFYWFDRR